MKVSKMFPGVKQHKKVQMPAALSAGTWTGKLVAVHEQHSPKGSKRKWTKYTIEAEGGVAFTTFSHTNALLSRCAIESDEPVEVGWEIDGYGGKEILLMQPVEEEDILVAEPDNIGPDDGDIPY
jgi:hypothetical protein